MSGTFERIKRLVMDRSVRVSDHGYDELVADDISFRDVIDSVNDGQVVEDYPDYPKGPCVLVLQSDGNGNPLHVLWGIPKGHSEPAVVVTAYRPDPSQWENGFTKRRT